MIRCMPLIVAVLLGSCGGSGQSSDDFDAYRKNPQTCSADGYFLKLSESERIHYAFGALHSRPQAACIVNLLARQDYKFLSKMQSELERRGGIYDRYAFIEAVAVKRNEGGLTEAELQALQLDRFCIEIDASSNRCSYLLNKLKVEPRTPTVLPAADDA